MPSQITTRVFWNVFRSKYRNGVPESDKPVLVYLEGVGIESAFWDAEDKCFRYDDLTQNKLNYNPSHWAYCPAAPKLK